MNSNNIGKIILVLSVPLALLITAVSCIGIFTKDFYIKETFNWQAQCIGQDMVDLFVIAPALLLTAILAYKENRIAAFLWAGTILYILYTFIIYCFDIHFNQLFIIYCFILGLSFYSIFWFLYSQVKEPIILGIDKNSVIRVTGIYFIILPLIFYFLWLSEIFPAIINNTTPKSLIGLGLSTNPVQIIDLSVFLPGIFITGLLILKRGRLGFLFVPMILTFFILMDITIAWLAFLMRMKGLQSNLSVTMVMTALALFSTILFVWNLRNTRLNKRS